MAKAASPIRLQSELMRAAEVSAKRFHRSTTEQIEYWADLGRRFSSQLDPDVLLSIAAGMTTIKTEPVYFSPVDPEKIFEQLEIDRQSGLLQNSISSKTVQYQASKKHPGYLEQLDKDGRITTGKFENGQFIVMTDECLAKK